MTGPPVGDALRSVRGRSRSRSRSRLALPSLVCPRPATRHPAADGRSCTASIRRIKGKGAVAGCALRQAGPRVKADAVRCRDAGDVISDRREAPAAPAMAPALAGPVAGGSRQRQQRTQCRPCRPGDSGSLGVLLAALVGAPTTTAPGCCRPHPGASSSNAAAAAALGAFQTNLHRSYVCVVRRG